MLYHVFSRLLFLHDQTPHATWNASDSSFPELRKATDHLFRAARSQQEVFDEKKNKEREDINRLAEYYPRRELVDLVKRVDAGADCQIRPVYLPDFAYSSNKPRTNAEMKSRVGETLRTPPTNCD